MESGFNSPTCTITCHIYASLIADETGGVVIDVGHSTTKIGFAGEDTPKSVVPSHLGITLDGDDGAPRYRVGQASRIFRPGMELKSPIDCGFGEYIPTKRLYVCLLV